MLRHSSRSNAFSCGDLFWSSFDSTGDVGEGDGDGEAGAVDVTSWALVKYAPWPKMASNRQLTTSGLPGNIDSPEMKV